VNFLGNENLADRFSSLQSNFAQIAEQISNDLSHVLAGVERIDTIFVRVKSIESFMRKAKKKNSDGSLKYPNPLMEIQDQVGARVVAYYCSDVKLIRSVLLENYREREDITKKADHPSKFGYEAHHMVCDIPPDILGSGVKHIPVFELQTCTLFQHAWAEANHDIIYKADEELPEEDARLVAFAASQAWGADKGFQQLWDKYGVCDQKN